MGKVPSDEADNAIRKSIIAIVASLFVFAVIVGAWKINLAKTISEGDVIPPQYDLGQPIIVSSEGIGKENNALPSVDLYFSYSCPACATLEESVGTDLAAGAEDGQYNLLLHPVNTAPVPFQGPATSAALVVAANDPEHFLDFNHALLSFFWAQHEEKNNDIVGNLEASAQEIASIAVNVGVNPSVINQFGTGAAAYLKQSTADWKHLNVENRERTGTPEVVVNNRTLVWSDPAELLASLP